MFGQAPMRRTSEHVCCAALSAGFGIVCCCQWLRCSFADDAINAETSDWPFDMEALCAGPYDAGWFPGSVCLQLSELLGKGVQSSVGM